MGDNNYFPPKYVPGTPIYLSMESIDHMQKTCCAVWYHQVYSRELTVENMKCKIIELVAEQIMTIEQVLIESRNTKPVPLKDGQHSIYLDDSKTQILSI